LNHRSVLSLIYTPFVVVDAPVDINNMDEQMNDEWYRDKGRDGV
jgi:hypothetical protein